ncbi:MAG: hypothetical protein SVE93_04390 [Candidatus Thermoplasmatota archaeon]|nr:hypothetical protein [Candidatus Thermoplasmatota archaeon]
MKRIAILLLFMLVPCVIAEGLSIEIVDYRHSSRYVDKEDCYKGEENGIEMYLTGTIIKIRVTAGAPIPDADVRITYELDGKKEEYFKTDVWGEVEITLPSVERKPVEVRIDAVAQPEEGFGGISGSKRIIVVPYMFRNPGEFLSWRT